MDDRRVQPLRRKTPVITPVVREVAPGFGPTMQTLFAGLPTFGPMPDRASAAHPSSTLVTNKVETFEMTTSDAAACREVLASQANLD